MAKVKSQYTCNECGGLNPKWVGQCPDCGAWNTLTEIALVKSSGTRWQGYAGQQEAALIPLPEISAIATERLSTGLPELDQVLGGGVVEGSVILIGGDPGIGKSTLLLQALANVPDPTKAKYPERPGTTVEGKCMLTTFFSKPMDSAPGPGGKTAGKNQPAGK